LPAAETTAVNPAIQAVPEEALDRVRLRDGQEFAGQIMNERIPFQTAYARFEIAPGDIATLDLRDALRSVARLRTTHGDLLTGYMDPATEFVLKATSGTKASPRRFRSDRVGEILFRGGGTLSAPGSAGLWFYLRNGDRFRGRIRGDELDLLGSGGVRETMPVDRIETAFLGDTEDFPVGLQLKEGSFQEGRLASPYLNINLTLGVRLQLFVGRLEHFETQSPLLTEVASRQPGSSLAGLVWIPAGSFTLGSPPDEQQRDLDEGPLTKVVIPGGYWIGRCEVTQAEFETIMDANPSQYGSDLQLPVDKVSWEDAMQYCQALTLRRQESGRIPPDYAYRLPTEAEWEYACRAGTNTRFGYGEDPEYRLLGDYAWYSGNADSETHVVGLLAPNPWGLHDMHGNVWEWCLDHQGNPYPGQTITNVVAVPDHAVRVARGGSWLYGGRHCRSANRDDYGPSNRCSDVGFRVVLAPIASGE